MQHTPFVSSFTFYRLRAQVGNIDDGDVIIVNSEHYQLWIKISRPFKNLELNYFPESLSLLTCDLYEAEKLTSCVNVRVMFMNTGFSKNLLVIYMAWILYVIFNQMKRNSFTLFGSSTQNMEFSNTKSYHILNICSSGY